jgi:2-oxoisovalerate dehydrogenase E1 component beta subunit
MGAHTTSDDPTKYRVRRGRGVEAPRPDRAAQGWLLTTGRADGAFFAQIAPRPTSSAPTSGPAACLPEPAGTDMFDHVYGDAHPVMERERAEFVGIPGVLRGSATWQVTRKDGPAAYPMTTTLAKGITSGMRAAMERDPKVVLMGEDIGKLGGVFRVTEGLQKDFGEERVIDTPLAEAGIMGTAVGLALRGYRPVVEIQFDGFVYRRSTTSSARSPRCDARSLGHVEMPIVVRIPFGGGIGAVEHHSESNEAYFAHTAGLRVVACSNPHDAHWMIQQAIECRRPGRLLRAQAALLGQGRDRRRARPRALRGGVLRQGTDVTLLAYGPMVRTCLQAAQAAAEEGRSLEVIDLRSLSPLDTDTIVESVRRTGRCVVVHEASTFLGLGAEIAALIQQECFYSPARPRSPGSAATTCLTRRAGSRRSSSPTSTGCSMPSTADGVLKEAVPHVAP